MCAFNLNFKNNIAHFNFLGRRFRIVTENLRFTDVERPAYTDKFWEIRQLVDCWNNNMRKNFVSRWINCLDESMMIWFNKWTCPGWIFCPRKPHPYGNEWHSMCCGLSSILFVVLLVEGKDRSAERPRDRDRFGAMSKTASLLLTLCASIFATGKVVILDSGFCVLEALIELRKRGVFSSAVVKKRRYWPKWVPGEAIKEKMADTQIGDVDSLKGMLCQLKTKKNYFQTLNFK